MNLTSAYKYQYDPLGTSSDNHVTETRTLSASDPSVFVTFEGLFFGDSLVITKAGTPLTEGTDYELEAMDGFYTETLGQDIYAGIKIKTANMYNGIDLEYQCLGGAEGTATSLIRDLTEAINTAGSSPSFAFGDIIGFPPAIPPTAHKHPPSQLEDLDLLAQKFDDFVDALVSVRFYKDSNYSLSSELLRLTAMVGSLRTSMNGIAAITGYAEEIEALEKEIKKIASVVDKEGFIGSGNAGEILRYPLADFNVLEAHFVLMADDGSKVQYLKFHFLRDGTNVYPVPVSNVDNGSAFVTDVTADLAYADAGSDFVVSFTPPVDFRYKTKYTVAI